MIIHVENGVGKRVAKAIDLFQRNHGAMTRWQNDVHPQMQRTQQGDEWWIADVASRGWIILTADRAILDDGSERQALIDHSARMIAFRKADYTGWQMVRALSSNWKKIDETMALAGPQAVTVALDTATVDVF